MHEWITLHYMGKEAVIDSETVLAFYGVEDGTLLMFSSGEELVVDEDITEVKAEMFL